MTKVDTNVQEKFMPSRGWISATPLEKYTSIHELSIAGSLGWDIKWPRKHLFIDVDFNMHIPHRFNPNAFLTLQMLDIDKPPAAENRCYTITDLTRWRMRVDAYSSFEAYLSSLIRWHRCNYVKSEKTFKNYGCDVTVIDGDWSQYADEAFDLYTNVALRHGDRIYDRNFFHMIAKHEDYKLLCAWLHGKMVGMFVLLEEMPTLHHMCCGFDYVHSSKCYAYSWLHYELIRIAIDSQKYQDVDVGMTADTSKREICFEPIPSRIDVYTNSFAARGFMRAASAITTATITPGSKLKFKLK